MKVQAKRVSRMSTVYRGDRAILDIIVSGMRKAGYAAGTKISTRILEKNGNVVERLVTFHEPDKWEMRHEIGEEWEI